METFKKDGVELTWSAPERLIRIKVTEPNWIGTGKRAEEIINQIKEWTRGLTGRYRLLVNCAQLASVDASWRAVFYRHFRTESPRVYVAWFHASPFMKVIITMFIMAIRFQTPFEGQVFESEPQARAWLQQRET